MAEVSTIPAYVLANESLLFWMLKHPLRESMVQQKRDILQELVYVDFHRWNVTRPDHVFQHRWECFMHDYVEQKDRALSYGRMFAPMVHSGGCSLVLAALQCVVDEYIEVRHDELHVKMAGFGWWQNMLSRMSSLPVQALAYLQMEQQYGSAKQCQHLHLLYPYDEGVETYIAHKGLNDSHVHVNLCAYAEECWLNALTRTSEEWSRQKSKFDSQEDVPGLYRQIHVDLTPELMERHMMVAKRLRHILVFYANDKKMLSPQEPGQGSGAAHLPELCRAEERLAELSAIPPLEWLDTELEAGPGAPPNTHRVDPEEPPDVNAELQWMMKLLRKQMAYPSPLIDRALHLYLLLMNEFMTFCVQRDNFVGFKQFQKYSALKKDLVLQPFYYRSVFEHMHGAGTNSVANYAELRIAPEDKPEEMERVIRYILLGYLQYARRHCGMAVKPSLHEKMGDILHDLDAVLGQAKCRLVRPTIVFHLIKRPWKRHEGVRYHIRYEKVRMNVEICLDNLGKAFEKYPALRRWVRGIDAAAYELDTPPDVFAPAFRRARYGLNIQRATYHAGEDFYHLVSGIRVVCEAVKLLNFRSGDRIGHATALGVEPSLWMNSMPSQVTPTQGDWLQDLVFAWSILQGEEGTQGLNEKLSHDIRELGYNVFRQSGLSPYLLKRVFDLRALNPIMLMNMVEQAHNCFLQRCEKKPTTQDIVREIQESPGRAEPHEVEKIEIYKAFEKETPEVLELLIDWHRSRQLWERSEKRIEVPTDYFTAEELLRLQRLGLRLLVEKTIIIETLPSSNLRIGQYKEMSQHHSMRWLGATNMGEEPRPLVVLGTDDPGVFATDIKAEFYHLFASLVKHGFNSQEALDCLSSLNQCGARYAFRSLTANDVD